MNNKYIIVEVYIIPKIKPHIHLSEILKSQPQVLYAKGFVTKDFNDEYHIIKEMVYKIAYRCSIHTKEWVLRDCGIALFQKEDRLLRLYQAIDVLKETDPDAFEEIYDQVHQKIDIPEEKWINVISNIDTNLKMDEPDEEDEDEEFDLDTSFWNDVKDFTLSNSRPSVTFIDSRFIKMLDTKGFKKKWIEDLNERERYTVIKRTLMDLLNFKNASGDELKDIVDDQAKLFREIEE